MLRMCGNVSRSVKFIDPKNQRKLIYTDFEDELGEDPVGEYSAPFSHKH